MAGNIELSNPQGIFLNGLNTKFRAYVGGFGSGKTFVGCLDLLNFFAEHPGTRQGYFGPSYPAIRDIFYPTFEEAAELLGFTVDIKESNKEVHVYRSGFYYGTVICRSMDNPKSIVGFKISRALCDELDVLTTEKANQSWVKIIARMRLVIDGVQNSIGVTTTPEGFKFVYSQFAKSPTASYSMVQASTYENEKYLPPDYISSLMETYPEQLISSYLKGEFVNLTSGAVYTSFDRFLNKSRETMQAGDVLHIGMDFNVGKMSAVVHVKRAKGKQAHAVGEVMGALDTPAMIAAIQAKYPNHKCIIYPDASGNNRKSCNASETDISQLKEHFEVRNNAKNPFVKDRVASVQAMLCNANDERHYFINPETCPDTTESLEQQVYNKQGEPDKSHDNDHPNDALGYFIHHQYPVRRPVTRFNIRR